MSSKTKAFIGITVSVVVLIILFTSNGGFRASRAAEEEAIRKGENTCSAAEKVEGSETVAVIETQ